MFTIAHFTLLETLRYRLSIMGSRQPGTDFKSVPFPEGELKAGSC